MIHSGPKMNNGPFIAELALVLLVVLVAAVVNFFYWRMLLRALRAFA